MNAASSRTQFQRWQALYLLQTRQMTAQEVGEMAHVSANTIYQWVHIYNRPGELGLVLQGRGGHRREWMSLQEEEALLEGLWEDGRKGGQG